MRGMGTLIIFFVGAAVVYAIYWFNRAVAVSRDAKFVLDHGGSVSDALRHIKDSQNIPDQIRLSARQSSYVNENHDEFFNTQSENIREYAFSIVKQKSIEQNFPLDDSDFRFKNAVDGAFAIATLLIAKKWCENRGIQ